MAKRRVRTIVVVVLLILTVALASGAVYLSYWINKNNQKVEPSSAAGTWTLTDQNLPFCSGTSCTIPQSYGTGANFVDCSTTSGYLYYCPDGLDSSGRCLINEQSLGSFSAGQSVDVSGWLSGKCGAVQFDWNSKDTALHNSGNCGGAIYKYSGTCGDGGGGTVTPTKAVCGESCTSDSDCIDESTYGVDVICKSGKCVNSICPTDTKASGTLCLCTGVAVCGEKCGSAGKGLCGDGRSSCTYVTGSACAATNNNTYCVPTDNPDVQRPKCVARDTGNSYLRLISNPTKTSFTAAEVLALCNVAEEPVCGDGTLDTGEECEVGHTTCPTAGETCDVLTCQCSGITTQQQCEDLNRVGTDPVGLNEVEQFNVVVSAPYNNNQPPYPISSVRLRVSTTTGTTPVGEDRYNAGQTLVTPYAAPSYDLSSSRWTYNFAWRATGLTNGTYDVEVSFDGGTTWESASACVDTFTYDSGEEVEPTFVIVKTGTSVCTTAAGAVINYTLRVTNLGPGSGVIDYVEDELDTNIEDSWVSNISSSKGAAGSVSGGTITWNGTEAQRTFTENESATYTYRVSIPSASLDTFTTDSVQNVATVVFGDNQTRYNLSTPMNCPGDTNLPSTGIMDNTPWILGTFAVIIGFVAFKLQFGQSALYNVLDSSKKGIFRGLGLQTIVADQTKDRLEKVLDERASARSSENSRPSKRKRHKK